MVSVRWWTGERGRADDKVEFMNCGNCTDEWWVGEVMYSGFEFQGKVFYFSPEVQAAGWSIKPLWADGPDLF